MHTWLNADSYLLLAVTLSFSSASSMCESFSARTAVFLSSNIRRKSGAVSRAIH